MNILCLDTSTELLRIGLAAGDFWYENLRNAGFRHGETLIPQVASLLAEAELAPGLLDLVVCTRGPGSFTGLRIGMASAKGLAEGAACPLVTLSTLELYGALESSRPGLVIPLIDARKDRFYACVYREGREMTPEMDASPEEIFARIAALRDKLPAGPVFFTGPGVPVFQKRTGIGEKNRDFIFDDYPRQSFCSIMIDRGLKKWRDSGGEPPESGPEYIRPSEAEISNQE